MSTSAPRRWLVEGLVIVVSILLAFAVDAWWDARRDRAAERTMRDALRVDFEAVLELLPVHLTSHEQTVAGTSALIDLVRDVPPGSTVDVPDSILWVAMRNGSFDAPTGALDALLASGDLRLISDPELRRMLAAWPARLRDATEDDRLLREFWAPELRRILAEDADLLGALERRVPPGSTRSTPIVVSDPMRSLLPDIRGSSNLALVEERALMALADSIVARLEGRTETRIP